MKKIMIIGAGPLQLPGIKKAKEMGLHVVAVDMDPNAVALKAFSTLMAGIFRASPTAATVRTGRSVHSVSTPSTLIRLAASTTAGTSIVLMTNGSSA